MSIRDYSASAGLNTAISGINIGEGAAAANINNAIRQLMADLKSFHSAERVSVKDFGATGLGLADDTAAVNAAIATLTVGQTLYFPAGNYLASSSSGSHTVFTNLPVGTNVYMEPSAWVLVSTSDAVSQVFTPGGDNILQVNVNGQSLPDASAVESGGWVTESHAIRSAFDATYGIGATGVTVINSRFKNLNYAIQTQGAQRWKIINSRFSRIKLSAILHEYLDAYSCLRNLTLGCDFEECGDTAVAYHKQSGTTGECAFNIVANCTAKNTQLRTQGFAFDHEENSDPTKQHHNLFTGLTVEQTVRAPPVTVGRGGAVMNGCYDSEMLGIVAKGSLESAADFGISMQKSVNGLIGHCYAENFRAAGITTDGSTDVTVANNTVVDCGGNSSAVPAILVASGLATSRIKVIGNRVKFNDTYTTYGAATSIAIAVRNTGGLCADIAIENNTLVSKWGTGIYLQGNLHASGCKRVTARGNEIIGTATVADTGTAIQAYSITQLTLGENILSHCNIAYTVQNCTGVTIRNGEARGDLFGLTNLYDFTGSTGVRVRNMRCYVGVTTAVSAAGTATVWFNDDKVTTSAKGTTAARPTLLASDVGFNYLDTTLDPDGKPIWWNGTAWFDATGAAA